MEAKLTSMTIAASVDHTVQTAPYSPTKLHGFASRTYEVTTTPEDSDQAIAEAMDKEMRRLFNVCWHQIHAQLEKLNEASQGS